MTRAKAKAMLGGCGALDYRQGVDTSGQTRSVQNFQAWRMALGSKWRIFLARDAKTSPHVPQFAVELLKQDGASYLPFDNDKAGFVSLGSSAIICATPVENLLIA